MKIFVTFASAGTGHARAAEAIFEYFRKKDKNSEVKLIDVLANSNRLFRFIYSYGYAFLVHHCLWLWSLGFYITCTRTLYPLVKLWTAIVNKLNTRKNEDIFIRENPDFIISTHFLPSKIAAYLKRKNRISSKLFTVITDYEVHPFWVAEGTDAYIVASEATKNELLAKGISSGKIKVLGIPVDEKFLRKEDKGKIRLQLGIDMNKITVLVVTGSFGIGPIEDIVDALHQDVQILVVCARNKKLLERLKSKNYANVKVLGFVNNIEELMSAADIIVTKPGGVTISELLLKELAPVFISTISGQETGNLKVMQGYGVATQARNYKDVKNIVLGFKSRPEKLEAIREKIRKVKKPECLKELFGVVCEGSGRASG